MQQHSFRSAKKLKRCRYVEENRKNTSSEVKLPTYVSQCDRHLTKMFTQSKPPKMKIYFMQSIRFCWKDVSEHFENEIFNQILRQNWILLCRESRLSLFDLVGQRGLAFCESSSALTKHDTWHAYSRVFSWYLFGSNYDLHMNDNIIDDHETVLEAILAWRMISFVNDSTLNRLWNEGDVTLSFRPNSFNSILCILSVCVYTLQWIRNKSRYWRLRRELR